MSRPSQRQVHVEDHHVPGFWRSAGALRPVPATRAVMLQRRTRTALSRFDDRMIVRDQTRSSNAVQRLPALRPHLRTLPSGNPRAIAFLRISDRPQPTWLRKCTTRPATAEKPARRRYEMTRLGGRQRLNSIDDPRSDRGRSSDRPNRLRLSGRRCNITAW